MRQRGGLANARGGAVRQALAAPKRQQRTLRIGDLKPQGPKTKAFMPSQVRLKVRNFDEKQVTNDDLKVSYINIHPANLNCDCTETFCQNR